MAQTTRRRWPLRLQKRVAIVILLLVVTTWQSLFYAPSLPKPPPQSCELLGDQPPAPPANRILDGAGFFTTRRRYHIALGAARQLLAGGELSATGCGALKNHIFDDDGRVAAAVEIFWLNDDGDALRATLRALGLGATAPG